MVSEKENLEHYEENVLELKQMKTIRLSQLLLRLDIICQSSTRSETNKLCDELDSVEEDAIDSMIKLTERYNSQNDS